MSGFILNCCAPFKALRRFKVQEFKETLAVQAIPPLRSPKRIPFKLALSLDNPARDKLLWRRR
jgi:hypothetical protein